MASKEPPREEELDENIEFGELDGLFPATIKTKRLYLEKLSRDNVDVKQLYNYLNKSETIDEETEFTTWDSHKNLKQTYDYIDEAQRGWNEGDRAGYFIRVKNSENDEKDDNLAGNTMLRIEWDRRLASTGIWLRKDFWGKGYSGERAHVFFELAFKHLNLEVVSVNCWVENKRSKRAIEKYMEEHGGRHIGVLRNHRVGSDGEPKDVHHFSITQEEYLK